MPSPVANGAIPTTWIHFGPPSGRRLPRAGFTWLRYETPSQTDSQLRPLHSTANTRSARETNEALQPAGPIGRPGHSTEAFGELSGLFPEGTAEKAEKVLPDTCSVRRWVCSLSRTRPNA